MSFKKGETTLFLHDTREISVLTGESLFLLMDVLLRIDDISILGKFSVFINWSSK